MEEWNDQSISKLAQYVIHRKITLSFLDRRLQASADDEKYPLEESIHKIIFCPCARRQMKCRRKR